MNTCDEDIEADDKIIAEEGERELYEHTSGSWQTKDKIYYE